MDSFQRGQMNLARAIQDELIERELNEIVLENLGVPLIEEKERIEPEEKLEVVERKRPGRPRSTPLSLLKDELINFRLTSFVGKEFTYDFKGTLNTSEKVRQAVKIIFDVLVPIGNERYVIALDNNEYYAISDNMRRRLEENLTGYVLSDDVVGSDKELVSTLYKSDNIIISRIPDYDRNARQRRAGAFFKYLNQTKLDLTRQGIFSEKDERMNEVCLIVALTNGGLEKKKIKALKCLIKCNKIPVCKLEEICKHIDICISLRQMRLTKTTKDKTVVQYYGDRKNQTFEIGLVDEHYFLIETVPITSYALIHHYNDPSKFNVYLSSGKKSNQKYINSFRAVEILYENKQTHLKELTVNDVIDTPHFEDVDVYSTLEYNDVFNAIEIKETEQDNDKRYEQIIYLDFETDTSSGLHKPYLCHYVIDGDESKINKFIGSQCAFNFLKSLTCDTLIYAHNAGYDYKFLTPYLMNMKPIIKGNGLICCSAIFFNIELNKRISIYIKDTYKLISTPLSKFGKMFSLEQEKEILPYSIYTSENIDKKYIDIKEINKEFKTEEDKYRFLTNCIKWNVINKGMVDVIEYSSIYCRYDCLVLCQGFNTFRKWVLDVTNIDIHDCLTIPSMVHQYFIKQGVYRGICEISGIPRHFIQNCVVGGRVMISENKKIRKEECIINDFDGVSLYPSAMDRLGRLGGFLKGKPKVLDIKTFDFLCQQDGYFVKILIKSVAVKRKLPLMSFKNDQGIREFTNDMINKIMFVDKFTLEDLIEYHKITFDVIEGYYFNEGRNNKILEVINFLFNERLKKKKEGNPIQEVYKLIMNSSYGKTLLKPIETEKHIVDSEEDMKKFVSKYYDSIKQVTPLAYNNSKYAIETIKSIYDHFNVSQVGVEILSMSKRIMNEVICLAEDKELEIYYQDTDSLHIQDKDIKTLQKEFMLKFGRELIGKGLGQFHSDFDLSGCKDVIATKSIFLGKKSYIDVLEGVDVKTNEVKSGYHIRLKGIPNSAIWYKVNEEYKGDAYQLYVDLYEGKKVSFDLLEGGSRCRFSSGKNLGVFSLTEFKREVSF